MQGTLNFVKIYLPSSTNYMKLSASICTSHDIRGCNKKSTMFSALSKTYSFIITKQIDLRHVLKTNQKTMAIVLFTYNEDLITI